MALGLECLGDFSSVFEEREEEFGSIDEVLGKR